MFELAQAVKLASVNPRAEIHGEDRVPAFDLKIEAFCPNDLLIPFHPELRTTLYKKAEDPDLVEQLDGEALTALRFPKMGAIKWDVELTGYKVEVDYGLGGDSNIMLGEVKIDGFKISPQNGGSVGLSFRIICHPESEDVGRLCEFIQRDIDIKVIPPEPTTLGELFGEQKAA
ncbi:hypothetical protein SAMN06265795_12621 [Noviherbaspirillum humi]|uniref:Uncharacterized protein n=1 Tax=Noviherbaspirillum humi TaxID=1688639 RepID=A0A239LUD1_9BURK|nr:hypothetical protein [Noviherbaspirillum humi]SNT33413.1 hypothetical protein SAMN06265795_12621 [Noviherbaspirillum humi]